MFANVSSSLSTQRKILPDSFFARPTEIVARQLLGCEIVRIVRGHTYRSRIVEAEAYLGCGDKAAHCAKLTPRSKVLFGPPGHIYIYFIYGNYFMLNFVTEREGVGGGVLIRAVEPLEGFIKPTNGPAKLVMAMEIDSSLNGLPIGLPHLAVYPASKPLLDTLVANSTRVGISKSLHLMLRFYEKNNIYVSRK